MLYLILALSIWLLQVTFVTIVLPTASSLKNTAHKKISMKKEKTNQGDAAILKHMI
jgi:hypothetical protein